MDVLFLRILRPGFQPSRAAFTVAALLALALAGCGPAHRPPLPEAELNSLFRDLHTKVYDVYGLPVDRDALYDLLRNCFAGDALTNEYIEHYTTLWRMQHDDTKITILRVDYADTSVLSQEDGMAVVEADWNVGGVVYHQGHSHTRINRYQAIYTIAERDEGYRIVDTKMKNMERVQLDLMSGGGLGVDEPAPSSGQGMLSPSDLLRAGLTDDEPPEAPAEATPAEAAP